MTDEQKPQPSIGEEGRRVREKFKRIKNREDIKKAVPVYQRGAGPLPAGAIPDPEHYHLCFTVEGRLMPHFGVAFPTKRSAYVEVHRYGQESEPNTEWNDDGSVLIESPIAGRVGLFRMLVSVAACVATRCRAKRPRSGLHLPFQRSN